MEEAPQDSKADMLQIIAKSFIGTGIKQFAADGYSVEEIVKAFGAEIDARRASNQV